MREIPYLNNNEVHILHGLDIPNSFWLVFGFFLPRKIYTVKLLISRKVKRLRFNSRTNLNSACCCPWFMKPTMWSLNNTQAKCLKLESFKTQLRSQKSGLRYRLWQGGNIFTNFTLCRRLRTGTRLTTHS